MVKTRSLYLTRLFRHRVVTDGPTDGQTDRIAIAIIRATAVPAGTAVARNKMFTGDLNLKSLYVYAAVVIMNMHNLCCCNRLGFALALQRLRRIGCSDNNTVHIHSVNVRQSLMTTPAGNQEITKTPVTGRSGHIKGIGES